MKLQALSIVLIFSAVFLIGCGSKDSSEITITDSDGKKTVVKTNSGDTNMVITDQNGDKSVIHATDDGANVTMTGPNGEKSSITTNKEGGAMTMSNDKGTVNIGGNTSVTEAELGVPFYPGSTEKSGSGFKVETDKEKDYNTVRLTSDEPEKVTDFYKGKLKDPKGTVAGPIHILTGLSESGAKITVMAEKKDGKTEISVGSATKLK
jgi:hypothetical protein